VTRTTCRVPPALFRSSFARARPSSSMDEAFRAKAESWLECRVNFCQEDSEELGIFDRRKSFHGRRNTMRTV
jgi:hypothetical protein